MTHDIDFQAELEAVQEQAEALRPSVYKPDDDHIVTDIISAWDQQIAFFHGEWYEYEAGCWRQRDIHELRIQLRKFLRPYRDRGVKIIQTRINGLAQMLEDDLYIADRRIIEYQSDTDKYLNMRNGLFNLETMRLESHRRDLYLHTQFDFEYDPTAQAPGFLRYLKSSLVHPDSDKPDAALMDLMLEALGYSLTARTDLKASFWLVGKKDSGKSTLVAMLKNIFGSLHGTIDLTQLGANRFMLSEIVGKRVVTFTENSAHNVLPDALYKALVGGSDEIYADVKNRPGIAFRPEAKLWWAMNEKPRILDRSGATFSRLHIIPFNRTIPVNERIGDLEQILIQERSGILNWMLSGYQRLVTQGTFTQPTQSQELREKYRFENDTEATFVEECCTVMPTGKTEANALFQTYKMWCDRNGFRNKNRNQVSEDWERLGFIMRKNNKHFWHGVQLKGEWNSELF